MTFTHPVTGQVLETKEDFSAALAELDERMMPLYRERRALREGWVETFEPPDMPRARYRTATQEKVARCPRCGERLDLRLGKTPQRSRAVESDL